MAVLQTTARVLVADFRGSPRVQIRQASGAVEGRELRLVAGLAVNLAVRLPGRLVRLRSQAVLFCPALGSPPDCALVARVRVRRSPGTRRQARGAVWGARFSTPAARSGRRCQ